MFDALKKRGDTFDPPYNYLIFAHRYRGSSFGEEFYVNVEWVADVIQTTEWAHGDRSIVLVSSINATEPTHTQSLSYNLSKASLNNMARYFKKTHRINTVSPNTFTGQNPIVTAMEVSNVICFLCSPESSGINGQDIRVDR